MMHPCFTYNLQQSVLCSYDVGKKVQVCREWEATACQVNQEDVRLVLLRIGVVLGKDGGALGCCVSFNSFFF